MAIGLAGCGSQDTLETIRQQQSIGDFESTLEPLRRQLAEAPDDPELNYLYGRALVQTQQLGIATWPLRRAMEHPDWQVPAAVQLAQIGLVSQDFNEVVHVTTRVLESHPDDPTALLFRAQANAHWKKDPEAALADAEHLLEIAPDTIEAYEPLILAFLALGRREEASERLAEAGRRLAELEASDGQLAWHCSTTAIFAADAGRLEESRERWEGCLERFPADPTVVSNALAFFDGLGDSARSLEILQHAYEESSEERVFRLGLVERLRRVGRVDEGESILREATQSEEAQLRVGALADLARYLHNRGDFAGAAATWGRAVEAVRARGGEPGPAMLFSHADALVIAGQLDRALEVAERLTVPAQRRLIRGRVAQEQGDYARALEEIDEALRLWPNNPSARYYAAVSAEQLGDFDRALEEYRYAIRSNVGATDARTRAARLLIAERQLLPAYQVLFLEVEKAPLEVEGEMLSMYLMGRVANPKQLQSALTGLAATRPALLPRALVRGAEGVVEIAGPEAALSLLTTAPGIDYEDPQSAPALRAIVEMSHAAGKPEVAEKMLGAARAAQPESAVFVALEGLHRELGGAATEEIREAYERALEGDPEQAEALAGLARLALEESPERALALFDGATNADPSNIDVKLGAVRALRALGRSDEALARLDVIRVAHPFDAATASERVAIDLARETVSSETLVSARRAVRFGGGLTAVERLAEVQSALGESEAAEATLARLQSLNEQASAPDSVAEPGSP